MTRDACRDLIHTVTDNTEGQAGHHVKFRVERDVLAEAVAWAARSLPARPPVPVLAGLLLEATRRRPAGAVRLRLRGLGPGRGRRPTWPRRARPGVRPAAGRHLPQPAGRPVEIATDGVQVIVTCGSSRFTLLTMPVEEYPALPEMPTAAGTLGGDAFAAAVAQVAIAAGRDDTLPVLTGVRMEIEGDRVTLAATDRYRLAVRELSWKPEQADLSAVALVPASTLADTAKSLTSGAEVTIALARPAAPARA